MTVNLNSSLSKRLRRTVKREEHISFKKLKTFLKVSSEQLKNCLLENEVGGCIKTDGIGSDKVIMYLSEPFKEKRPKTPGRKSIKRCLRDYKRTNKQ